MAIFSNLSGTMQKIFKLGKKGATLEYDNNKLSIKNFEETQLIPLSIGEPVDSTDATTLNYVQTHYTSSTDLNGSTGASLIGTQQLINVQEFLNNISTALNVSSISSLREVQNSSLTNLVNVSSYYDNPSIKIGGGYFYYDSTDTTTLDDGVSCIVTNEGARYKRVVTSGAITPQHAGSLGNGSSDDTSKIISILEVYDNLYFPDGTYNLDCNQINVKNGQQIHLSSKAIVNVSNTSGQSGPGYSGKVFTIVGDVDNTITQVSILGGNFNYIDDTISVVGVGSYTDGIFISEITANGLRLIDVSDSASVSSAVSQTESRPKRVVITNNKAQMISIVSKGPGINFRLAENCETDGNEIYGYQYGIQWSGGDASVYTDLSYERKCKSLRIKNDIITAKYAGIWGSLGDDIIVSKANCKSTTTTASDVGIDFEGCTNCIAESCYTYGFTNGGLTTYYINSNILFVNCTSVAPVGCRVGRINNSLQIPTNTNIRYENCYFKGEGAVSKLVQAGAVDNLVISGCTFDDVFAAMASNNNGKLSATYNNFRFSMLPTDYADQTNLYYAALLLAYANNNERLINIKGNTFYSSVSWTTLGDTSAICCVSNNFNAYTRVEIVDGGTYSTSWGYDISLVNGSGNSGITIGYKISDFTFGNKSVRITNIGSATLYPIGKFHGQTTGYIEFPASITDNISYTSCYYSRGQRFTTANPSSSGTLFGVVTAAGLGTSATVTNLTLN